MFELITARNTQETMLMTTRKSVRKLTHARTSRKGLIGCFLAAFVASSPVSAGVLFDGNFETSSLTNYNLRFSGNKPTIAATREPSCTSNKSMKVTLDRDHDKVKYRTEITRLKDIGKYGTVAWRKPYWVNISVYLPGGWLKDQRKKDDIVLQFHHGAWAGGLKGSNPPLTLRVHEDRWEMQLIGDSRAKVGESKNYQSSVRKQLGRIQPGRWTTFTMKVQFDPKGGGFAEVWRDEKKVASYRGKLGLVHENGPYLKSGLYKPYWRKNDGPIRERLLYIDNLQIATGDTNPKNLRTRCN